MPTNEAPGSADQPTGPSGPPVIPYLPSVEHMAAKTTRPLPADTVGTQDAINRLVAAAQEGPARYRTRAATKGAAIAAHQAETAWVASRERLTAAEAFGAEPPLPADAMGGRGGPDSMAYAQAVEVTATHPDDGPHYGAVTVIIQVGGNTSTKVRLTRGAAYDLAAALLAHLEATE